MNRADNLQKVLSSLPFGVRLVAVSKTQPSEVVQEVYDAGQRIFGENKAQDMAAKSTELPDDIEWHFIGHLQTNKVKYIGSFVHTIHSVESLKLLQEINKRAAQHDRIINCLIQLRIAKEETKFGLPLDEAHQLLQSEAYQAMGNIRFTGVMGMATFTDDQTQVREEFRQLKEGFEALKSNHFSDSVVFSEISMGMSGDYPIAIEEGSTVVRVGTSIFGPRNYN